MKFETTRRLSVAVVSLGMLVGMAASSWAVAPRGQEPQPPATTEPARKPPRGRLPAYYAKVVTPQQREDIYAIQAKYNAEIEKLQMELEALEAKRDMEVEGVLTDEQRAEVAKMQEDARARRSARSGGAPPASGTSSDGAGSSPAPAGDGG